MIHNANIYIYVLINQHNDIKLYAFIFNKHYRSNSTGLCVLLFERRRLVVQLPSVALTKVHCQSQVLTLLVFYSHRLRETCGWVLWISNSNGRDINLLLHCHSLVRDNSKNSDPGPSLNSCINKLLFVKNRTNRVVGNKDNKL